MIGGALVILDLPEAARPPAEAFWSTVLGCVLAEPAADHPGLAAFRPPSGRPVVFRQVVADGPPRVHLDLEVDDLEAESARLRELGAAPAADGGRAESVQAAAAAALTSPGGAAFCLVGARPEQDRPPPVRGRDGVRRRLVQLCLDVPRDRQEAEVRFWRQALPWSFTTIDDDAFAGRLVPSAGAPLEVLLQVLGADDPGTTVRAHLDLGSDDREATAAELVALGAERLGTGDGWIPLRDPVGQVFCVTGQSPDNP